ncbi:octanoyl-[GcvH]:protein N-octanoyltransferase [Bacillus oleivorans]|uniref:Octanoyl-[GcvH]:protein N-octanoyltransferase n=1 Tax=Bacillus oleivorans TaxID=1448271 RepID=A0A285CIV4_9BACI|nr:biotin/lipoate A/B protein ligase family protein [Bacillus oleivorans]SNX66913.1 octanoyl-[GcvH]:protein N-octanoyltransferase [Bacillus oleivorans]
MKTSLLKQPVWRIIDHTNRGPDFDALESFAIDDTLCTLVGKGQSPAVARAWVHHRTVVLGIQDTKLPYLEEGIEWLKQNDYHYLVRTSGGLAVLLDEGVLNLSLILPEAEHRIGINLGYDTMVDLIKEMYPEDEGLIDVKEISESYCPGSYDLSINGKKFAGISQRRIRNGVAVQIYLCVTGSGAERAAIVREFYKISKKQLETKYTYPQVNPDVMGSLAELLNKPLTMQDAYLRFLQALKKNGERIYMEPLTTEEWPSCEANLQRLQERNQKLLNQI